MSDKAGDSEKARKRGKWKRRRRWIGGLGLLILLVCLVDYYAYPYGAPPGGRSFNRGENGLWLRYTWAFGKHGDADIRLLAGRLEQNQIRYAYFHVRDVTRQGMLRFHHPDEARHLIALLHREAPSVKVIAWVYAGDRRGAGEVDIGSAPVRKTMVAEAAWLIGTCGFDGVQWDYEIADNDDPGLVALLHETRAALPSGKILSVATALWLPAPLRHWGWSDDYFARIARECDQVAVMCYDSGAWMPRTYVWLVRQQAIHVTQDVARGDPRCRVLLGIPTYGKGFFSHNPRAENIRFALRGVREGLADPRANTAVFAGVAPFADYTTDAQDWQTYHALWPRN